MITLISSTGNQTTSLFDLRFGRASWFCLLNEETGEFSFHENTFKDANQGAGGKVVEWAMGLGVRKVISGDFGPKAKDLLDKFKVQMLILPDEQLKINEIIDKLTSR